MNKVDILTSRWFTISTQIGGMNIVDISTLEVFWKRWNTTPSVAKKHSKVEMKNKGGILEQLLKVAVHTVFFYSVRSIKLEKTCHNLFNNLKYVLSCSYWYINWQNLATSLTRGVFFMPSRLAIKW